MPRKLAHMRFPGAGAQRMFASPTYVIPHVSPSVSHYDIPQQEFASNVTRWTPNGTFSPNPAILQEDLQNRVSANFSSLPAQHLFQGLFPTRWTDSSFSGMKAYMEHAGINMNYNPAAAGSKEQQRATVYEAWPSFGALSPKII